MKLPALQWLHAEDVEPTGAESQGEFAMKPSALRGKRMTLTFAGAGLAVLLVLMALSGPGCEEQPREEKRAALEEPARAGVPPRFDRVGSRRSGPRFLRGMVALLGGTRRAA
jgi:hypothetical protein